MTFVNDRAPFVFFDFSSIITLTLLSHHSGSIAKVCICLVDWVTVHWCGIIWVGIFLKRKKILVSRTFALDRFHCIRYYCFDQREFHMEQIKPIIQKYSMYISFYPAMTAFTDQYSLPNIFFDIGQL
jgi:hypothetical protein